ncbi:TetR/AcrR family transcriptional regulator [Beijerinckia sp. L45]|uniref:TetR/AcrR family transcriptional regulator n=1 Tax=Beijerinckia sp. L45 TaxID=1641855 RepID=UPI002110BD42|nr:TetR/AcrR family transcriptional regulator [Beijerinckia sp. L45]
MPRANVREKIVEAALRLFHERGYNASGIQDIVSRAGVPKGSFYNHFASKEALGLEAITRDWDEDDLEVLREEGTPPLIRVRRHFELMAGRFFASGFSRGCLLGDFGAELANTNPAIRAKLSLTLHAWTDAVSEALREARAAGDLRADEDVELLARFLLDAWGGCVSRGRVTRDRSAIDDFFKMSFAVVIRTPVRAGDRTELVR